MIGERITKIREERGLSRAEVAAACEKTLRAYSAYERGDNNPPADVLARICEVLNVSADYLLGLTDQPERPEPKHDLRPDQVSAAAKISSSTYSIAKLDKAAPFTRNCLPIVQDIVGEILELQGSADLIYEKTCEQYPAFAISDLTTEEDRRRIRINEQLNDPQAIEFIAGEKAFEERVRIKIEETAIGIVDLLAVDLFNILRDKVGADVPILCRIVKTGNAPSQK